MEADLPIDTLSWLNSLPEEFRQRLIAQYETPVLEMCTRLRGEIEYANLDVEDLLLRAWYLVNNSMYEEIEEAISRPLASGRLNFSTTPSELDDDSVSV